MGCWSTPDGRFPAASTTRSKRTGSRPSLRARSWKYLGPPLTLGLAELTGQPPDSSLVTACVSAYRVRYGEVWLRETTVVPGMETVLASSRRHRLAVATSKPLVYAEPLLETLGCGSALIFVPGAT